MVATQRVKTVFKNQILIAESVSISKKYATIRVLGSYDTVDIPIDNLYERVDTSV